MTPWRPIQDICKEHQVSYESVRRIVKQADNNGETWVKKVGFPHPRWLIDTDHPNYQQQIVDVLSKPRDLQTPLFSDLDDEEDLDVLFKPSPPVDEDDDFVALPFSNLDDDRVNDTRATPFALDEDATVAPRKSKKAVFLSRGPSAPSFAFLNPFALPAPDIVHTWPQLCSWLTEQGLCIFYNALSEQGTASWQWQWGDLSGNGCISIEDALLSALQEKLAYLEELAIEKDEALDSLEEQLAPKEGEAPETRPVRRKWPF
jgi:hypothetical protein